MTPHVIENRDAIIDAGYKHIMDLLIPPHRKVQWAQNKVVTILLDAGKVKAAVSQGFSAFITFHFAVLYHLHMVNLELGKKIDIVPPAWYMFKRRRERAKNIALRSLVNDLETFFKSFNLETMAHYERLFMTLKDQKSGPEIKGQVPKNDNPPPPPAVAPPPGTEAYKEAKRKEYEAYKGIIIDLKKQAADSRKVVYGSEKDYDRLAREAERKKLNKTERHLEHAINNFVALADELDEDPTVPNIQDLKPEEVPVDIHDRLKAARERDALLERQVLDLETKLRRLPAGHEYNETLKKVTNLHKEHIQVRNEIVVLEKQVPGTTVDDVAQVSGI